MDHLLYSVHKLQEGLEHMDKYDPVPSDDEPIWVHPDGEAHHEFATSKGQLCLGNLRDILALLKQHGIVLNANS